MISNNLIEGHDSVEMYMAEHEKAPIFLVKNYTGTGLFLPRVNKADFLLFFPQTNSRFVVETVKHRLLELGKVQGIFAVDNRFIPPKKLKHFG